MRNLVLPLIVGTVAFLLCPESSGVAAYSTSLTLNRLSHGYLARVLCDFSAWGISDGDAEGGSVNSMQDQHTVLKPWLRHRYHDSMWKARSVLPIEYNILACQCDGEQCLRQEMEPGSILSICLWTTSDKVDFVRVSEMIMTQEDQVVQLISDGVPNDFTTMEQSSNGGMVVHTLVFPDVESIPSNVVVDGTVYFAPKNDPNDDRNLLVPEDGSYFRVEVPLLRHIPSKQTVRDLLVEYLQRPDFAISFGVLFFLWLGLCIIFSRGSHRDPDEKNKPSDETDDDNDDYDTEVDEEDENTHSDEEVDKKKDVSKAV